jgi:hypothetical protein
MRFQQGTSKAVDTQGNPYQTYVWRGPCDPAIVFDSSGYTEEQSVWAGFWAMLAEPLADAAAVEWRAAPVFGRDEQGPYVRARFSIIERTDG